MIIFRSKVLLILAAIPLSGCQKQADVQDERVPQLQAQVDDLERKLQANGEKDDRVLEVLKSEMIARRRESSQPERGAAMKDFLDEMEKSKTDRRLDEFEGREFLRSQGGDR